MHKKIILILSFFLVLVLIISGCIKSDTKECAPCIQEKEYITKTNTIFICENGNYVDKKEDCPKCPDCTTAKEIRTNLKTQNMLDYGRFEYRLEGSIGQTPEEAYRNSYQEFTSSVTTENGIIKINQYVVKDCAYRSSVRKIDDDSATLLIEIVNHGKEESGLKCGMKLYAEIEGLADGQYDLKIFKRVDDKTEQINRQRVLLK